MPCKIARYAGYCAGVRKAVEEAHAAAGEAREKGLRCYSLGAVIHNPEAVEALRREGITKVFGLVFKNNEAANAFWEEQGYSLRTNLNYRNKSLNENVPKGE